MTSFPPGRVTPFLKANSIKAAIAPQVPSSTPHYSRQSTCFSCQKPCKRRPVLTKISKLTISSTIFLVFWIGSSKLFADLLLKSCLTSERTALGGLYPWMIIKINDLHARSRPTTSTKVTTSEQVLTTDDHTFYVLYDPRVTDNASLVETPRGRRRKR